MARLPVVVGFGGVSPSGRTSFHHGYLRLVFDRLESTEQARVLQDLLVLTRAIRPEGDGWIVQVCNRLAEHRSDLLLFDALEIEKGPIATVQVPIRLRFGGAWRRDR